VDLFEVSETLGLKDYGKFIGTEWTVESLPFGLELCSSSSSSSSWRWSGGGSGLVFRRTGRSEGNARGGRRAAMSVSCLHSFGVAAASEFALARGCCNLWFGSQLSGEDGEVPRSSWSNASGSA
jgi:hypothetical protein